MEVKIMNNEVRIIGKNCGKKYYLKVYLDETQGRDRYVLSTIDTTFETCNLPTILMTPDNIILDKHGKQEIIV